ncbi:hypothetical protein [Alicyclobacillus mengziensis]|uniref:Uncharacterized protein n=1 Tax=Alicyclobacillus mengziensis TaxID=2931921 RepID=A0A9X7W109_9BACL|nr:hypothetical protein [Alicyclobacillus mengziensis]QSO48776.1 hypothetical protein JZ786_07405 [Alicyclobacillus mengziensis]
MNQDVEKVYRTVTGLRGVVFENFPVYRYDGQDFYLMRDEWLAERIEKLVPENLRPAARFDCRYIPEFHEALQGGELSKSETKIMKWLQTMSQHGSLM